MPEQVSAQQDAQVLLASRSREYVQELARTLSARLTVDDFGTALAALRLTDAEAAKLFGVTRQAVYRWRTETIPTERLKDVFAVIDTTQLLRAYVRPERLPAVVRRPAAQLAGRSLLEFAEQESPDEMFKAARFALDLRRVAS